MSLRQLRDAPADPPDEESQSLLVGGTSSSSSPEGSSPRKVVASSSSSPSQQHSNNTAHRPSPAISAFDAMAAASNTRNPLMLARLVARKFLLLLTTEEEEDPSSPLGYSIGLLKDIILGVVFGVLTISFAVLLDHRNVIHIQSAHHLRDSAYAAMSDPETIQFLEAETDLRFMSAVDYESAQKEINDSLSNLELAKSKFEERTKELEEKQKELASITEEKTKLMSDPKFAELDNFCGSCKWGPTNCDNRVAFLGTQYNIAKIPAMLSLMKDGNCKK